LTRETGKYLKDPHGNAGYISISMAQADYTVFNQGYYYFEFKAPEVLEYTGGDEFNSLLEITETRDSVNFEDQYLN
jgi:hypothetical protein